MSRARNHGNMMTLRKPFATLALVIAIAGCSDKTHSADDSAAIARNTVDSAMREGRAVIPEGDSAVVPAPRDPGPIDRPAGDWEVTPQGIGAFHAGMSVDELKVVARETFDIPDKLDECAYIRPKNGPKGVALMLEKGVLSRVDITSGDVATAQGAKIGSSEEEIKSLYPGQVTVKPHKYTSGHYLVVTPPSDADSRIVFETDGKKVLRYRSGKEPAVEYVEGCA